MVKITLLPNVKRVFKEKLVRLATINMVILAIILVGAPAFANYFNGGTRGYSGCTGAAATIETADPIVVTNGSSSSWAAVVGSNSGQYVQVGWAKDYPNSPRFFTESRKSLSDPYDLKWWGSTSAGAHNDYMVGRDSTTWYFKINGNVKTTVAVSALGWTGQYAYALGETWYSGDHCPGTVSNPVTIGNAQYKNSSYVWNTAYLYPYNDNPTNFANNVNSNGDSLFEIWDKR